MIIDKKIISLDCTDSGRVYCIQEKDGYTLIDTGMPRLAEKIMSELLSYNIKPNQIKRILLTHGDVDHIGNVEAIRKITNCDVYADNKELPYIEKEKHYSKIKHFLKFLLHIKPILGVKPLAEKQIGEIEIIKSPGHTPGHVCYKYNEYIFIGDLVGCDKQKVKLLPKLMTNNYDDLIKSIKSLNIDKVKLLLPAHGDNIDPIV
jgi:glyoxylase-like metal-dependent hydrolase (beta-lactamase superfamily II)